MNKKKKDYLSKIKVNQKCFCNTVNKIIEIKYDNTYVCADNTNYLYCIQMDAQWYTEYKKIMPQNFLSVKVRITFKNKLFPEISNVITNFSSNDTITAITNNIACHITQIKANVKNSIQQRLKNSFMLAQEKGNEKHHQFLILQEALNHIKEIVQELNNITGTILHNFYGI